MDWLYEPPILDFEPIFFVIDMGRNRTMAVKKYDRYEMSGVYIEFDGVSWSVYPANLNNQHIVQYERRYELTKESRHALFFPAAMNGTRVLTEEQCNHKYCAEGFWG